MIWAPGDEDSFSNLLAPLAVTLTLVIVIALVTGWQLAEIISTGHSVEPIQPQLESVLLS